LRWHDASPRGPRSSSLRKITAGLFISLDGVVEDPQNWHFPYYSDEMGVTVSALLAAVGTLLLSRNTYDSFAGAWPGCEATSPGPSPR
jgi:hypothetical protein